MALRSAKATLREKVAKILKSLDDGEKIRQSEKVFNKVNFINCLILTIENNKKCCNHFLS